MVTMECCTVHWMHRAGDLTKDIVAPPVPEAVIPLTVMLYSKTHVLYVNSLVRLHNRHRTHLIKFLKLKVWCMKREATLEGSCYLMFKFFRWTNTSCGERRAFTLVQLTSSKVWTASMIGYQQCVTWPRRNCITNSKLEWPWTDVDVSTSMIIM